MSSELDCSISVSNLPAASEKLILPIDEKSSRLAAQACDVIGFENLKATFRFKRWRKHGVMVLCDFSVKVEQECIATLEPVVSRIDASFERQFLPENSSDYKMPEIIDGEMILDPEASDIPDVLEGDAINLWDVLIEEMILVIDPFPRSDNAPSEVNLVEAVHDEPSEPTHKPFSDLKALISEKKSNK